MRRAVQVRVAKASLPLAALALALGASCGGCSSKRQDRAFERELTAQLGKQLGPLLASAGGGGGGGGIDVRCSDDPSQDLGAPEACVAKVAGVALPLALRREGEQLHWQLEGLVVSGGELEQDLTGQLTALGLSARPRCGPPLQAVIAGERVSCSLSELGIAWATVRADGSYSWELALGEAQAERTQQVEEAQLDELSRALDRAAGTEGDGGEDEDEDGEAAGSAAPASAGSASAAAGSAR